MYKDCYKQFLYPTYTEKQKLSHAKYLEIIEQLSICQIDKINIIPATIEKKELFSYLLSLSRQYSIKTQIIEKIQQRRFETIVNKSAIFNNDNGSFTCRL